MFEQIERRGGLTKFISATLHRLGAPLHLRERLRDGGDFKKQHRHRTG